MRVPGNGTGIATTAGAPLVPGLASLSQDVPGFSGIQGHTLFGAGNVSNTRSCSMHDDEWVGHRLLGVRMHTEGHPLVSPAAFKTKLT